MRSDAMNKPYLSTAEQIKLLESRGLACDEQTPTILRRDGYYAVVNGYAKAFLESETPRRGRTRFRPGTTFGDIHELFLADRELRSTTFRAVMSVEGTLRAVLSHSFCQHHPYPDDYLDRRSYCSAREYLYGSKSHADDLRWLIDTLDRHARGHDTDDVRILWYVDHYDSVPLWVLFSDLTFGNLRYFFALMRRQEQKQVCAVLEDVCGPTSRGGRLTPQVMLDNLEVLGDLRNACAHEERIYDARFGSSDQSFADVLLVLRAYLAEEDEKRLGREAKALLNRMKALVARV